MKLDYYVTSTTRGKPERCDEEAAIGTRVVPGEKDEDGRG